MLEYYQSSPADAEPVFRAIVEQCRSAFATAKFGIVLSVYDGGIVSAP